MVKTLENKGLMDNTIIIFASDHGLLMGEYGMGRKALLYDLTSKIPCFIYDPTLPKNMKGKTLDNFVSSLDITKTILDYAGADATKFMEGQSLRPLLYDKDVEWRDEIFLESLYTGHDNPFCEAVRKGDWKYVRMYDGIVPYKEEDIDFLNRKPDFEQLFNLKDDPTEHNNLIDKYKNSVII